MAAHPGMPRNVIPPGFEDDPMAARTFNASGEEVGWL